MKHYGLKIPEGSSIENMTAPSGTSFPSSANAAEMFFRTDDSGMYFHNGTTWELIGGTTVATSITVDTFTGTGSPSNLDYTLTTEPNNESELLVYVGGVYQEQSTYSVSGTTLTLTESPADGVGIEVVLLPTSISGNTITNSSETATGGQTTFNVTYTAGNIFVYLNGAKLVNTIDYTAVNGTSVILTTGAAADDIVAFEVFAAFQTASTDHTLLTNIGTNTHAQIDTVIANLGSPVFTDIVQDTTPQLGGNLDTNGFDITSSYSGNYDGNITIEGASKSGGFGKNGGNLTLIAGNNGPYGNPGDIVLKAGQNSSNGVGGRVYVKGGYGTYANASSSGGVVQIQGGRVSVSGYTAGDTRVYGGNAAGVGNPGNVIIKSGIVSGSNPSNGGDVTITASNGAGSPSVGGTVTITSGTGGLTSNGGNINITGGFGGSVSGDGGNIVITPGKIQNYGSSGRVQIMGTDGGEGGQINLFEGSSFGTSFIGLKTPYNMTGSSRTWTLPEDNAATSAGKFLTTDTFGNLSFAEAPGGSPSLQHIVEDLTPQLGGDLAVNGNSIVGLSATTPLTDTNGNELISFVVAAVANNGIVIENSSNQNPGGGPTITVQSGSADTGLHIAPKAGGYLYLGGGDAAAYVVLEANTTFKKSMQLKEVTAGSVGNAYSGYVRLYADSGDTQIYSKDDVGNTRLLSVENLGELADVDIAGSPAITAGMMITYNGVRWEQRPQNFGIQFTLDVGENATFTIDQDADFGYTIESAVYQSVGGTITGDVKIGGTSVTGLSALSVSTTETAANATAANTVVFGNKITIVTTANSNGAKISIKLKCTKT